MCDTAIGGLAVREGEEIWLLYSSANRDEDAFEGPYRFDISRTPHEQLGFRAGAHFCLGANLGRREMAVMFRELFRRMPDIEVTPAPVAA